MTRTVRNRLGTLRTSCAEQTLERERPWPAANLADLSGALVLLACLFPLFLLSGCSVLRQTHETVRNEHLYSSSNRRIEKQMEEWAEQAFLSHCGPDAMLLEDKHYRKGFQAGFARFLRTGSTNEPLLPPPEYLKARYVSWEGRDAVNRWIRGHEVGATAAAQSGYRELIKIPVLGAIAPDDNQLPPAESVVVDAVIGEVISPYEPVHPQPIPPSLPMEDELAPIPQQAPPVETVPQSSPSADREFDAFSLPIRSSEATSRQFPGGPTSQADPARQETRWDDTVVGSESSERAVSLPSKANTDTEDDTREFLDRSPADSPLPQYEELSNWSVDANDLTDQTASLSEEELDFQWLETLPDEAALDEQTHQERQDAAWGRTRAAVPPSLEQEQTPQAPAEKELWLHPPETPAQQDPNNDFGFPDSSTITVVFEEPAAAEPAAPTEPAQPATLPATTDIQPQPTAAAPDKASLRRTALYAQIANATKPEAEHVDQCVQPAIEQDAFDETAWPDLDTIMSWPAVE